MKKLKKLAALLLAVVMTMAMNMTVFADDATPATETKYTLTLNGTTEGHTYEAYQIFSGDLNGSTLSNVEWGKGVDPTKTVNGNTLIAALKADTKLGTNFSSVDTAKTVAEALAKASDDDAVAQEFATVVSQYLSSEPTGLADSPKDKTSTAITGLSAGYYLVKDKDGSVDSTKKDSYTRFILRVVKDTKANLKNGVPTVEKKVKDTNDSKGETTGWQDSADYDVNDSVPFQITGTMPANIGDYTTYKYKFTDTMSKGLTFTAGSAKIMIGTTDVTSAFTQDSTTGTDGSTTVTWSCDDLKAITDANGKAITLDANTKVVVTYNATLNDNAVIGSEGNLNKVYLTYSNNPNKGGDGNTGKTPEDENKVFTYKVVVNKVDQDEQSLAGAAFKLEKKQSDGTYKEVKSFKAGEETTFEFDRLDDGDYKLTETTTPDGYNTINPIEFTIDATHDTTADDPQLTEFTVTKIDNFSADKETGSVNATIVNKKGSVLPSTGGVGTHMFYVFGGCLVAAAVVLLTLKKRREA